MSANFGKVVFFGTAGAMLFIGALQADRAYTYRQGFQAGVGTALCTIRAASGESLAKQCADLPEGQRNYAVRVGREIADNAATRRAEED